MPYKTISNLPKAQLAKYSVHQKKAFLEAFNNAFNSSPPHPRPVNIRTHFRKRQTPTAYPA